MIGLYLDKGLEFFEAVKKTLEEKIQGTWGLVIMHKDYPNKLIACRNGSPMMVSTSEQGVFVSSHLQVIQNFTSDYIEMRDGEIIMLDTWTPESF